MSDQPNNTSLHTAPYYPTIQQFQRLFDYSLDVLCYFDAAGRFVQASKASVQLWGYAPQELVGKPFTDLVMPEDLERSLHTFAEGKKGGKGFHVLANSVISYHRVSRTKAPNSMSRGIVHFVVQLSCLPRGSKIRTV